MVCPMLEPVGSRASCRVLWHKLLHLGLDTRDPRRGGMQSSCPGGCGKLSKDLWLETQLIRGMRRFLKVAPAAPHQLGTGWGCVCSLLRGEVSLWKVRSKQQILLQKNAVSHILHQLIFFWRANHCSFEKGTKEISLTSFSASLQYSVHQMCPVYQKIQMLQLSFGIT